MNINYMSSDEVTALGLTPTTINSREIYSTTDSFNDIDVIAACTRASRNVQQQLLSACVDVNELIIVSNTAFFTDNSVENEKAVVAATVFCTR